MIQETRIGAYGLCLRDGRVLLIDKAKGPFTGMLDLPGGGIEFGETPEEAVVREFMEETGVVVAVESILGAYSKHFQFEGPRGWLDFHHLGFFYRVQPTGDTTPRTEPDGLDSLGAHWIDLADLAARAASPLVHHALDLAGRATSPHSI
ncbi:MAG TPA: NUDIX hydrolase [Symbiobacteriaceae bacterium]|jgi:8-oxo-dGTP pyrophosphatase MutT (NUDIX family)